jgi:cobalt-zinc-cadmium efflux system outer membrane protein
MRLEASLRSEGQRRAGTRRRIIVRGGIGAYARKIIYIACASSVVACASYLPQPLAPAETASALDGRTLDDRRLQKFIAASLERGENSDPVSTWDLSTLTLAAIYYHRDLDIAHAKLAVAKADAITARQRPNPTLNFTSAFGQAAVAGAIPAGAAPLTIGPVVDFIVETAGKREYRTEQARHLEESARWDLATAGWQVRGRVRDALLDLWVAQRRLSLTGRRLELQEQLVGLLERRFAQGEASSLDVARERINRAQITLAARDLERSRAEARVQLASAIGIAVEALGNANLSFDAFDRPPAMPAGVAGGELRREALTKRTDVQAALGEYGAAQSALQLEIANQYPNVRLGPGYNYDLGNNKYILGIGADVPFFHQNQGPIAKALANRQQALASFIAVQAQIIGAVDQAEAAYGTATRTVATADALLADEERLERQVEGAFRAGQVDRPTLVAAQLGAAATAVSRFDALVQQMQAIGALEDALQQPLLDPGYWPAVPEQNPRFAPLEPSS